MIGVGVGLTQPSLVAVAAAPSLSVVASPSTLTWAGGAGAWSSEQTAATPSNATGTPTYFWEILSDPGGLSYLNENGTLAFESVGNDGNPNPGTVTLRCTVTDDLGSAVSNTVTVS